MREAGIWLGDGPDYFQHEGGFLSYEPMIPADLDLEQFTPRGWPQSHDGQHPNLEANDILLREHVRLVNFQLHQVPRPPDSEQRNAPEPESQLAAAAVRTSVALEFRAWQRSAGDGGHTA
jgi:hypothetical protein